MSLHPQFQSSKEIYTVKQFNELVNAFLSEGIGEVVIRGEISGYQLRQNKWVSFDLKDGDSIINCFASIYQIDMPLQDGQAVLVTGTPRIYVPYGKYSVTVRNVQLTGEGALQKAFAELKIKLETEGLFDPKYKKPIPKFPQTIGIITSKEGAAIHDIQKVLAGRMGGLTLYLLPVLVQGNNAPDELTSAITYFNTFEPVDVILFGRGGGSLEDLQAFNSEKVARAIFASNIPIICGVGHEHNTCIADLVADVRAATPSNAAELCVQDRLAIAQRIHTLTYQMEDTIRYRLERERSRVETSLRILPALVSKKLIYMKSLLHQFGQAFEMRHQAIQHYRMAVATMEQKLTLALEKAQNQQKTKLDELNAVLQALSPKRVLERGYTLTYNAKSNTPLTSHRHAPKQGSIKTIFHDGELITEIGTPKPTLIAVKQTTNQSQLFE